MNRKSKKKGKNMTTEEKFKSVVSELKKAGATIESHIIDFDHTNKFWYDGDVVVVKYREHEIHLFAEGYIVLEVGGNVIRKPIGAHPLSIDEQARTLVVDDKTLRELIESYAAKLISQNALCVKTIYPGGYCTYMDINNIPDDVVCAMDTVLPKLMEELRTKTQKNPRFFEEEMTRISKSDDPEKRHEEADKLLLSTLKALNPAFYKGCDIFEKMERWYS